jgi:hypothetical protein
LPAAPSPGAKRGMLPPMNSRRPSVSGNSSSDSGLASSSAVRLPSCVAFCRGRHLQQWQVKSDVVRPPLSQRSTRFLHMLRQIRQKSHMDLRVGLQKCAHAELQTVAFQCSYGTDASPPTRPPKRGFAAAARPHSPVGRAEGTNACAAALVYTCGHQFEVFRFAPLVRPLNRWHACTARGGDIDVLPYGDCITAVLPNQCHHGSVPPRLSDRGGSFRYSVLV